jgi:peptidoglycan/LPS O-acetylase OafA/YrhL
MSGGAAAPAAEGPRAAAGYRAEIGALRAAAVLAVLAYHLWPARLPGGFVGVDVFFVVSGFLITGIIARELAGTGRLGYGRFMLRRARRLVPAATVALVGGLALTLALLPRTRWLDSALDGISSLFYVVNWTLIARAQEYTTADAAASVFQHFWSLAVEGQFYLVWPALLAVLALAALHRGRNAACWMLVGTACAILASLAWSIIGSAIQPQAAYFSTLTRAWEFGIGGLVALLPAIRATGPRLVLGFLGWMALAASLFVIDTSRPFPGWIALLPVGGAVLVILGGEFRWNRLRAVSFFGETSYSLYLWHWPLIVVAPFALGRELTFGEKLVLVALCIAVAAASTRLVERRFWARGTVGATRTGAFLRFVGFGAACALALATVQLMLLQRDRDEALQAAAARATLLQECYGAGALLREGCPVDDAPLDAALITFAAQDWGAVWNWAPWGMECHDTLREGLQEGERECSYGDADADYTVAIVGDSHAAQWAGALMVIADARDWRVLVYDKGGCPVMDTAGLTARAGPVTDECVAWSQDTMREIAADRSIDAVLTSSFTAAYQLQLAQADPRAGSVDALAQRYATAFRLWVESGKRVLVLGDTPQPGFDVPDCLAKANGVQGACSFAFGASPYPDRTSAIAASRAASPSLTYRNPAAWFCSDGRCPAVIGGVVVYVDDDHMSSTYARSLVPQLESVLDDAGWPK